MPQYARLHPLTSAIEIISLTTQQYTDLAGNPKQAFLRPLVVDQQPTPTALQVVERGPIVVEPTQARQTWALRDKTAGEIDADSDAVERTALVAAEAFLESAAPTTLVQAAADIQKLKRVCKWLFKRARGPV